MAYDGPHSGSGGAGQASQDVALPTYQKPPKAPHGPILRQAERRDEDAPSLPQIVTDDTDLVLLARQRREQLGIPQLELDYLVGLEEGYTGKMEGQGRAYGRRPTRLTRPMSLTFERETGRMVTTGRSTVERPASSHPVVSNVGYCWLQALGLRLVLMDREQADALCSRPIPVQAIGPRGRTGRRYRRVSIEWRIMGAAQSPRAVPPINPADLRSCARAMAKAKASGRAGTIANAIAKARAAGLDAEALSMAVSMTPDAAVALSSRLAALAAYLHALEHPDVSVAMVDAFDHQRDESDTEITQRHKAAQAWAGLST